jgi:hypothetical protein
MKQVILDTATARTPQEIYAFMERESPQPGDSLKVLQRPMFDQQAKESLFLFVLIAMLWYMGRKDRRDQLAAELLDDVFKKYHSVEELEQELKEEFNISVTTETRPDTTGDWSRISMGTFERAAYGDDEPDISHIAVREPDPEYKPWKKDA